MKLVAETGVGTVAAGVAKAHSDVVLISGHDGGTGASPLTSLKHAGIPWELGLAETQQTLVLNKLRDRIIVQTDGQLKTGRDVVIAGLLGAEEFGFATAPLVVMGCILMRVCHLDTCPVGIATQNPALRENFRGKAEHVVRFFEFIAQEVRELMAAARLPEVRRPGRAQRLARDAASARPLQGQGARLQQDPAPRPTCPGSAFRRMSARTMGSSQTLDMTTLVPDCMPALERGEPVSREYAIRNIHRTVGTILGSELTRRYGGDGLPGRHDLAQVQRHGRPELRRVPAARHHADARGRCQRLHRQGALRRQDHRLPAQVLAVRRRGQRLDRQRGALRRDGGRAFFRGRAGERFAVRNSGVLAVVEGAGDHCCEYMTGGVVLVIGPTGRNFAAGMSGGRAFVLDASHDFPRRCNLEMVDLEPLAKPDDLELVRDLLTQHAVLHGQHGRHAAAQGLGIAR